MPSPQRNRVWGSESKLKESRIILSQSSRCKSETLVLCTPKTLFLDFKAKGVDVTSSVVCYRNRGSEGDEWDVLSSYKTVALLYSYAL